MREREYLVEAIELMALRPRYVQENIDYLHVDGLHTLTFPMTCFCDIPLSKADEHMGVYSLYGIALNKNRCLSRWCLASVGYVHGRATAVCKGEPRRVAEGCAERVAGSARGVRAGCEGVGAAGVVCVGGCAIG